MRGRKKGEGSIAARIRELELEAAKVPELEERIKSLQEGVALLEAYAQVRDLRSKWEEVAEGVDFSLSVEDDLSIVVHVPTWDPKLLVMRVGAPQSRLIEVKLKPENVEELERILEAAKRKGKEIEELLPEVQRVEGLTGINVRMRMLKVTAPEGGVVEAL